MLETLLEHPFFLNRHRDAPLLNEREVFLRHLQQQGTSRVALWNLSGELIHVVRLLQMEKLRDVSQEEIHGAAQRWARQQRSNPNAHSYGNSASFFIYAAKKWLCFHGRLKPSSAPRTRFADQLGDFVAGALQASPRASKHQESINMRTCPKVPPRKRCDSSCNR
jgi:integrase/recombinase XerD